MKIGVNTYSFIWSTPMADCLRRLHDLGYEDFEVVVNPPHCALDEGDAASRRRIAASLRAEGIALRSLNLPSLDTNLASPMARMRAYSVDVFRSAIDLASDLKIPQLVVVPGRMNPLLPPSMAQREAWMNESLEALIPYAQASGVGLALENVPFASFPDAKSLGTYVRRVGSPAVSVCYDAANAHFIGESPAQGLALLRDLVTIVHLSDTTRSAWRHDEVGRGDVPFAPVCDALDRIDYSGACMLEIIDSEPEAAILRSHRALAALGFPAGRARAMA